MYCSSCVYTGLPQYLPSPSPLTIGLFFWRKLKLILQALFTKAANQTTLSPSFARCVTSYASSPLFT